MSRGRFAVALTPLRRALLWVLPSLTIAVAVAEGVTLRPLGATNGLAAKVIPSLIVDRSGFLWVASREGLYRYDGYRAVRYVPDGEDPRSITDADLRSVYEDREGVIWVGTNTGGLNRFDPATGGFDHYRHDSADSGSLSNDSVYFMADGPRGDLWVGSQIGLNRLDRETGRFTRYLNDPADESSLSHDYVFNVLLDGTDTLWIATVGGGLNRWHPETDSFSRLDLAALTDGPSELNDVFGLAEVADGTLWAGTRAGLVRIDARKQSASRHGLDAVGEAYPLVPWLALSPDGALWVGTLSSGLLRLDTATGEASAVGETTPNAGQQVMSFTESNGALFVGTWGGGVHFGRRSGIEASLLGVEGGTGLRQRNVTSVMATPDAGRPWVGTFGGGPQRVDVERGAAETLPGESSDLWLQGVVTLTRTAAGSFFAGTMTGLWELEASGEPRRFFRHQPGVEGSLGAGYVTGLLVDTAGDLWAGVGGSGLYQLERGGERFTAYRHDPSSPTSLSGDYITGILEGDAGQLWVGTRSSGLNLCQTGPWRCRRFPAVPGSPDSLNHHHITALVRDSRGRVWVGTDGGGLHQALPGAFGEITGFRHWGSRDGLLSDSVMAVAEDDDGWLWISSREGLTRLHPETGRAGSYAEETGLPVANFNVDSAAVDDRYLHFGAVGGLLSIPRGQAVTAQRPAPVRVTAIESPRSPRAAGAFPWRRSEYVLAYGETLSIEFAVLDYSESLHEYEYRLRPDDPWTRLGSRHEVTFFGLAPGDHTFEVRGRDVRGLWSPAPPLRLEIVPPFWMTIWFRALALLVVATVGLGVPALRLRTLERRNRELTRLKDQRERALAQAQESEAELKVAYEGLSQLTRRLESAKEEERQHISRELHDELGQTLTAAKIQLQLLQASGAAAGSGERLESAVAMMDKMIGQVRSISLSLRPPLLDEAGLVPALEHYLGSLAQRTGIEIPLRVDDELPDRSAAIDTVLFRVIQEAVSNALRHSRATRVVVELLAEGGTIVVVVEDDGQGFDLPEVEARVRRGERLGLLGIRERLRGVEGRLDIDSFPGGGTRLEARVAP